MPSIPSGLAAVAIRATGAAAIAGVGPLQDENTAPTTDNASNYRP